MRSLYCSLAIVLVLVCSVLSARAAGSIAVAAAAVNHAQHQIQTVLLKGVMDCGMDQCGIGDAYFDIASPLSTQIFTTCQSGDTCQMTVDVDGLGKIKKVHSIKLLKQVSF